MKFSDEVRFCFGVAKVARNGVEEGIRLPPFEHTGKNVTTHKNYEERTKGEIDRAKKLTGKQSP